MSEKMHIANLGFFLNYGDGRSKDEVESEILKVTHQVKEDVHYDRVNGGSFENLEQEEFKDAIVFLFLSNIIESIYRVNEEKNFDPYIVVGGNNVEIDVSEGAFNVFVTWRLLQDMNITGSVEGVDVRHKL